MSDQDWDSCVVGSPDWRVYRAQADANYIRDMTYRISALTAERDTLLAVVNTLAEKRWFLDHVGAECTFEGSPMVQIGHLEDLVEIAEHALRGKDAS